MSQFPASQSGWLPARGSALLASASVLALTLGFVPDRVHAAGWNLYDGYTQSYSVTYANSLETALADKDTLHVGLSVGGSPVTVTMDTGSVGLVLSANHVASYSTSGTPGWEYYNSSGLLLTGYFNDYTVELDNGTDANGNPTTVTATLPVLVVTEAYCLGVGSDPCDAEASKNSVSMMGVGYDRNTMGTGSVDLSLSGKQLNEQLNAAPTTSEAYNLFLNIDGMAEGALRRGYIITPTGVELGLTAANTSSQAFTYAQLVLNSAGTNGATSNWQSVAADVTLAGTSSTATLLMDTGITGSFFEIPGGTEGPATAGTVITISLAGGSATYSFVVGDTANPQTPGTVTIGPPAAAFVNSGLHTYAGFNVLFDADGGFLGVAANGFSGATNASVTQLIAATGPLTLTQAFETDLPVMLLDASTINTSTTATFDAGIFGPGSLTLNGGTVVLNGAVTNGGGVTAASGTTALNGTMTGNLTVASGASFYNYNNGYAVAAGNILVNDGLFVGANSGAAFVNAGTVDNSGSFVGAVNNSGSWTNSGTLTGDVTNSGTFSNSNLVDGNITNTGSLTNTGEIEGDVTSTGPIANQGTVTGTLTVYNQHSGNGTVGTLSAKPGALVSPGNSVGTIIVSGDATFEPGSVLYAELGANGLSDLLVVGGTLVADGATLYLAAANGFEPVLGNSYSVIQAGSIASNFTVASPFFGSTASPFPFLGASLDGTGVLTLGRSALRFEDFAVTQNERMAASAAETLGLQSPLNQALALMSIAEVPSVFDSLSGEIAASAESTLQQQSIYLRDAVTGRVRQAFSDAAGPEASGSQTARLAPGLDATAWTQAYGAWGNSWSDGNAAAVSRSIGGFLLGADAALGDAWRVGLAGGYSQSDFSLDGVGGGGTSDNYDVAIYGGTRQGDASLRFGAGYTWHDIATGRTALLPTTAEFLSADYQGGTAQVFGEAAYDVRLGRAVLEPYVNLAYVNLTMDGFWETGGAAALTFAESTMSTTFNVLGMRLGQAFDIGNGLQLLTRGSLGWQHAFGDITPQATAAFLGSSAFTVAGLPIAQDAALIDAFIGFRPTSRVDFGLRYSGQIADDATDNAVQGTLDIRF
ncbi:outer membrane autotransporter barrel domain-containing protein [Kaistia soli DSM 19436]|uniref:Outer membrane autotransporter barrel domain-containing protein n=1 Tax=Kaistia soli DSM 19436 TaxID=1122133 RepID=A0A1M5IAB8_9HYPH|nr:autotransporter domain-containing protein [Kaistia soli]SHG25187.1 outer membrane autotransporter barrel domain-containing protein [Kaistia soli DSM 19436]